MQSAGASVPIEYDQCHPTSQERSGGGSLHEQADTTAALHPSALRFREDIDALIRRHRIELDRCVDAWFSCPPPGSREATPEPVRIVRLQRRPQEVPAIEATLPGTVGKEWDAIVPEEPYAGPPKRPAPLAASSAAVGAAARKKRTAPKFCIGRTSQLETLENLTVLERFTTHRYYEWSSFMLIFLNCILIGWETQYKAATAADCARKHHLSLVGTDPACLALNGVGPKLLAVQSLFCVLFIMELGLRWVCAGFIQFFRTVEIWWNVFDVLVVGIGLLDLILEITLTLSANSTERVILGNVTVFRVLRVIRVVRVVKVIRVMRFFRELRLMISGILKSAKSLLWVMVVLNVMFYIFGIVFTGATTSYLTTEMWHDPEYESLLSNFGTMDKSVLSLFMAISGGNDWVAYHDALLKLPPQLSYLFIFFITITVFGVTNVVIGIFAETAMRSNMDDHEVCVNEELDQKRSYLESMKVVFNEIRRADNDSITFEEFEHKLKDERISAYFAAMKLDVGDARTLFTLLDHDESNEISIDEFLTGCYSLQGESKTLDMKIMQFEMKSVLDKIQNLSDMIKEIRGTIFVGRSFSGMDSVAIS